MTSERAVAFEMACRAFEAEMWPDGPAHGSGSGVWASHKPRIAVLLDLDRAAAPAPREDGWEDARDDALDRAFLYTFQLSNKDYAKFRTALSSVAFVRVLEQDGFTVDRLAAARGEPALAQNPDVPWRDETLYYPAAARGEVPATPTEEYRQGFEDARAQFMGAARGEPGLDAHTYRMPDGRLHCRCVEPGLLGERVARQAFDWVMEHEVEPWASGPVLASHGATFARKFAALATPTTPKPEGEPDMVINLGDGSGSGQF